ncbi:MAG: hypothetical protein KHZ62_01220 [Clostridiales bacterium]|nr:hypothetical protein [Clostridiales bacterium]
MMKYLNEKVAYLRGLCEGSGYDETTKEGKIFDGILDILDDMADIISALDDDDYVSDDSLDYENGGPEYTYSFTCPNCGEEIEVEEEVLNRGQDICCRNCGATISTDRVDEEDNI